jgi:hypothetical protein
MVRCDEDAFVIKSIKFGRLSWPGCRGGTMVDVVHISSITEYAQAIKRTFDIFLDVMVDIDRRFKISNEM